ncbi:glycosyltransferase family 2 protein [Pedobacter frigiditerrae]|uniref:glycosyltransferase family 2 protein n=1 Tax=Pedobacter frigiditerrae TaxID=2530452 RepID=UPI00293188DC|nr:glycosyltransferase family 2 protein [Pedobacter frigiditerrae]
MRISVCIATYNGEKFVETQLRSILEQLPEDAEIIISDDNSTDKTLSLIESLNDLRIKIFHSSHKNLIKNFENAIKQASGDYIFLSDQDDKWLDGKVQFMMEQLQKYDIVVSDAYIGDADLNVVRDSYFEWRNSKTGVLKNFYKNSYLGCCMAFKSTILEKILPFPANIPMHDLWIGMMGELHYKTIFIPEKLMIYRRHGGNATYLNEDYTSNETLWSMIKFRVNLLAAVLKRSL